MESVKKVMALSLGVVSFLGGCSMTPRYARPEAPVPGPAHRRGIRSTALHAPRAGGGRARVAAVFHRPTPAEVIATALRNNQDLRVAILNVDRARAVYGIARAELLPTVDATGRGSRQGVPADLSLFGVSGTVSAVQREPGSSSWEIDFFGRIRSLKDKALQEYLATEQARHGAQILLVSAVANAYLAFAADRESLKLAQSTLDAQRPPTI